MQPRANPRNRPPSERPRARVSLALALSGALVLGAACRAPGTDPAPEAAADSLSPHAGLFVALQGALEDGEDELAGILVARLDARLLSTRERDFLDASRRILAGRELARGLELALESEPLEGAPVGSYRLLLRASQRSGAALTLKLPPADLRRSRTSVDERGVETHELESRAIRCFQELELGPGEREIELLTYDLPLGRALAVRESWSLSTRSGEFQRGDEALPAADVRVAGCERVRVVPRLEESAARPEDLARLLAQSEELDGRGALELALRIAPDEREATLTLLAPLVGELAGTAPAKVESAVPALRWLARTRDLGRDAQAWARYLANRQPSRGGVERGALDLPVSGARAPAEGSERRL